MSPGYSVVEHRPIRASGAAPPSLTAPIQADLQGRVDRGHYVFPVVVSSAVRMMSPLKVDDFTVQNCPPTPAGT